MDLISTPKYNSPTSRDFTTQRRAYLDTYAKKRNPTLANVETPKAAVIKEASVSPLDAPVNIAESPEPVAAGLKINPELEALLIQAEQEVTNSYQVNAEIPSCPVQEIPVKSVPTVPVETPPASDYNSIFERTANQVTPFQQDYFQAPEVAPQTTHYNTSQNNVDSSDQKISANLRALYMDEDSLTAALVKNSSSSSISHMRTIVASAFACGVIAVSLFTFFGQAGSQSVVAQPVGSPVIEVEAPVVNKPSQGSSLSNANKRVAANPDQPNNIVISGIGVNAPVEAVGMTAEGLMAVPKSYGVVGWYNKGVLPGQKGPAVLAGHFTGGYGGVFDKLGDVKDGDLITTTNGKGQSFTFKVTKKAEYDKDKVPMAELFKLGDGPRLEIITCSGKWQAKNYDKRLVVTAELVQ